MTHQHRDHAPTLCAALEQVATSTALVQLAAVRGFARDGTAAELALQFIGKCQQALDTVAAEAEHACPITHTEVRDMIEALEQTKTDLERMRGAPA